MHHAYWPLIERYSFLGCSVNLGPGWLVPFTKFCEKLDAVLEARPERRRYVRVKELLPSFGKLTLNYQVATEEEWTLADTAKSLHSQYCEVCGSPDGNAVFTSLGVCVKSCSNCDYGTKKYWFYQNLWLRERFKVFRNSEKQVITLGCQFCIGRWKPGERPNHANNCRINGIISGGLSE